MVKEDGRHRCQCRWHQQAYACGLDWVVARANEGKAITTMKRRKFMNQWSSADGVHRNGRKRKVRHVHVPKPYSLRADA